MLIIRQNKIRYVSILALFDRLTLTVKLDGNDYDSDRKRSSAVWYSVTRVNAIWSSIEHVCVWLLGKNDKLYQRLSVNFILNKKCRNQKRPSEPHKYAIPSTQHTHPQSK